MKILSVFFVPFKIMPLMKHLYTHTQHTASWFYQMHGVHYLTESSHLDEVGTVIVNLVCLLD